MRLCLRWFIFSCIAWIPFVAYSQRLVKPGDKVKGNASFYGPRFNGKRTASGEKFSTDSLTAAHPHLPFGSILKVTHLKTGDTVWVRVNDRGPFVRTRVIDLSDEAARRIGLIPYGVSKVEVELMHFGPVFVDSALVAEPQPSLLKIEIPFIKGLSPIPDGFSGKGINLSNFLKPDSSREKF